MNIILPILALVTLGVSPSLSAAEEGSPAPAPAVESSKMACCNTVCPVCGKAVDPKAPTFLYTKAHGPKSPELVGSKVGFDSDECCKKFTADPSKYEEKVWAEWQKSKSQLVK